ncbi:MAG: transcriptional repressor [Rickettsiales bacterium]|nr:transcriptional repressor [Rickettsiales bacterium]
MQECTTHNQCTATALQKAELLCEDKNLRFTNIRRKVLELVWGTHTPIKAYDILEALKGGEYSATPPTVYRALDFLQESRLVHKLHHQNTYIGCTHPLEQHLCQLLVCTDCGSAEESCDNQTASAIHQLTQKHRFTPQQGAIELTGLCVDCSS